MGDGGCNNHTITCVCVCLCVQHACMFVCKHTMWTSHGRIMHNARRTREEFHSRLTIQLINSFPSKVRIWPNLTCYIPFIEICISYFKILPSAVNYLTTKYTKQHCLAFVGNILSMKSISVSTAISLLFHITLRDEDKNLYSIINIPHESITATFHPK